MCQDHSNQQYIGGEFAPLINLGDDGIDIESMITTYNAAVTDTAGAILAKERHRKALGNHRCSRPL